MPPPEPEKVPPDTSKFFKKVSGDDPLAGANYAPTGSKFDFILNTKPKSKFKIPFSGLSRRGKIILATGGGLLLLLIGYSTLSGGEDPYMRSLSVVSGYQQDILRVGETANDVIDSDSTKDLYHTLLATITSDNSTLNNYMADRHYKIIPAYVSGAQNTSADDIIKASAQQNAADATYVKYLKSELPKYKASLAAAYKLAGPVGKDLLTSYYDSTTLVLNSLDDLAVK